MAYARRPRSSRGTSRRSSYNTRSSYRSRAVRAAPRRRSSGRRGSTGGARTVRLEIVQVAPSEVARPASVMMKAAPPAKKAKF